MVSNIHSLEKKKNSETCSSCVYHQLLLCYESKTATSLQNSDWNQNTLVNKPKNQYSFTYHISDITIYIVFRYLY